MALQNSETQPLTDERVEAERMRDVLVLVTHLVQSQETTVKLLLDCLYDVGSINLINQKLHSRSLNRLARLIARTSKPAFRIIALRWFQRQCPRLITNCIHSKVKFKPRPPKRAATVTTTAVPVEALAAERRELQRLRTQVRYLTGVSLGAIATLAVVFLWLGLNPRLGAPQLSRDLPTDIISRCQSLEGDSKTRDCR